MRERRVHGASHTSHTSFANHPQQCGLCSIKTEVVQYVVSVEAEIATYAASYVFVRITRMCAFGDTILHVLAKRQKAATREVTYTGYADQAYATAEDRS